MRKVKVEICRGTSCHLLGSQELLAAVKSLPPERQAQLEIVMVDCLKSCRQGPNIRIDGKVLSGLTPEELVLLLQENQVVAAD
ncbi:MAG: (2Fe-2S) ferredoxin domain-containing protein [Veillonellaceae bacterium]|nr:(2Fe-2S) ferredoxin domain-containing protein [Veillonellaceae bacterium]